MKNYLKNFSNLLVIIFLAACGGGGGGGGSEYTPTPTPAPTPAPTPVDFPVNFYYGDRIDYFVGCLDLNLNNQCDEDDLTTTTFENPQYNDHTFVLTTSDNDIKTLLDSSKRPYLAEINGCEGCPDPVKLRHPGHLYLDEINLPKDINMNSFTTAITPVISWVQTPGWYFASQENPVTSLSLIHI